MTDDEFRREVLRNPDGNLDTTPPPGVPAEEAARSELQRRLETRTRVVLRPLANPLPLVPGPGRRDPAHLRPPARLAGARPAATRRLALLAFVFPLQLLASVLGFMSRDSVAGTAWGSWPAPG